MTDDELREIYDTLPAHQMRELANWMGDDGHVPEECEKPHLADHDCPEWEIDGVGYFRELCDMICQRGDKDTVQMMQIFCDSQDGSQLSEIYNAALDMARNKGVKK